MCVFCVKVCFVAAYVLVVLVLFLCVVFVLCCFDAALGLLCFLSFLWVMLFVCAVAVFVCVGLVLC